MRTRALTGTLLLLAASCGGGSSTAVFRPPDEFPRFPDQSNVGVLWAEATFFTNHPEIFDSDLVRQGILPVALRVGLRGEDTLNHRLSESFDAHLYLQDGTALDWRPVDSIEIKRKNVADQVTRLALDLSLLDDWGDAKNGFVYFRVPKDNVRIEGTRVKTAGGGTERSLDLLGSLLAFTVTTSEGDRQVFVGLRSDNWSGR